MPWGRGGDMWLLCVCVCTVVDEVFTAFQSQTLEAHSQDVAATVLLGQGFSACGLLSW